MVAFAKANNNHLGISCAMDGTQDDLIFEEVDDEDPFEGFDKDEAIDFHENTKSTLPAMMLDESSDEDEVDVEDDERDDYVSPDSPGK